MTLTTATAAVISRTPGYCCPCPASSFLGRPDGLDDVPRYPLVIRGRRSGKTIFSACGASCACCGAFRKALGKELSAMEPEAVAGRWRAFVVALAEMDADSRVAVTVERMKGAGLL